MESFSFDIQMDFGSGWTSVLSDVRTSENVACEYGIRGSGPDDLIADSGSLRFALNNGEWNSVSTLGYYSLLHSSKRSGFDYRIPVRLRITYGGTTFYKFVGKLRAITPTARVISWRLP